MAAFKLAAKYCFDIYKNTVLFFIIVNLEKINFIY